MIDWPAQAAATIDLLVDVLGILQRHPKIGRRVEHGLRELDISRGMSGYLALYGYDELADVVVVQAVRHLLVQGHH